MSVKWNGHVTSMLHAPTLLVVSAVCVTLATLGTEQYAQVWALLQCYCNLASVLAFEMAQNNLTRNHAVL